LSRALDQPFQMLLLAEDPPADRLHRFKEPDRVLESRVVGEQQGSLGVGQLTVEIDHVASWFPFGGAVAKAA